MSELERKAAESMLTGKESQLVVSTPLETVAVSQDEHYEMLIHELFRIRGRRANNAHKELLAAKYEAGKAITESPLYKGKGHPGSGKLLISVGKDLNWSKTEMYSCVKFYEEYPQGFLEDGATWTRVKSQLNEGVPKITARKRDRTWAETKTSRLDAVVYSAQKVGKIWEPADQDYLEKILNAALTKKETPDPAGA